MYEEAISAHAASSGGWPVVTRPTLTGSGTFILLRVYHYPDITPLSMLVPGGSSMALDSTMALLLL